MITNQEQPRGSFYAVWVLLTSLSIPIAFILDLIVLRIITHYVGDFIFVNGVRHITEDYLFSYSFIPLVGLLTGAFQYGLLRRYLPRMGGWVLATAGGWILGVLLIVVLGRLNWMEGPPDLDLAFLLMGLTIGMGQWLLLRRRLSQAGWWIGATVVGWGLAGLLTTGNTVDQFELITVGLFPACATALILALLMKPSQSIQLKGA